MDNHSSANAAKRNKPSSISKPLHNLASSAASAAVVDPRSKDSENHDLTIEIIDETDDDRASLMGNNNKGQRSRAASIQERPDAWMRPYWLGLGLFSTLFSFWILDSLKDPIFALLVEGNINYHQPPAKLCSVATTLALVCFLEFVSNARKQRKLLFASSNSSSSRHHGQWQRAGRDVMDGGGRWSTMSVGRSQQPPREEVDEPVSAALFLYLGCTYCLVFLLVAYLLGFHPGFSSTAAAIDSPSSSLLWHVVAYFMYAMIESFGSLTVATFWSYANSTLSLSDAERFYGLIIAIAQIGAIGGSTMVTHSAWSTSTLLVVACMAMLLMSVVLTSYDRRFPASASTAQTDTLPMTPSSTMAPSAWSGIHLILKHNYVLLILGVSCLYEVSLTCLDYQMKLLGWNHFEQESAQISFAQFLGRFGQLTNLLSLLISSMVFPFLIRRVGLKRTLLIFPSLLVIATFVAYTAIPGNLTVLFVSISFLKAMTYSMHDPSKEMLYIPTSNAIKFRAKFWIDVVGERVAKAIGSSINTIAGSVDRSVSIGGLPSMVSAIGLWYVCYRVGRQFTDLIRTGHIVGQGGNQQPSSSGGGYQPLPIQEEEDDDEEEEQMLGLSIDDSSRHSQADVPEEDDPPDSLLEMAPLTK
mmetsp:Transcript_24356/g.40368  ORF Transcript_24356/g.40368 Transcript_24356/m.40368 type:complete len:641 (+) Transcript_24356:103-2025(+)